MNLYRQDRERSPQIRISVNGVKVLTFLDFRNGTHADIPTMVLFEHLSGILVAKTRVFRSVTIRSHDLC